MLHEHLSRNALMHSVIQMCIYIDYISLYYLVQTEKAFVEMQQEKLLITPKDPAESIRLHSVSF